MPHTLYCRNKLEIWGRAQLEATPAP